MSAALETARLDIRSEAHGEAMVREAAALLRIGTPVHVFCHQGSNTVLAFRARRTAHGFFMVAADYKKTGTWRELTELQSVALGSVIGAFRNLEAG